jgi:GT2 family glycosyltransferase
MPSVYIVILNYKRWQDAVECLDSVFRSTYKNFTAIVIDNDSQNDSLQYLKNWANGNITLQWKVENPIGYKCLQGHEINTSTYFDPSIQLYFVQNENNVGFAAGNNVVLQSLLKEDSYIWLLNPDIVIEKNTLFELVTFAKTQLLKSIIGSVIKSYTNREEILLYGGSKINFNSATVSLIEKENKIPDIDFIYGGSLFTHSRHFKEIGLLPQEYFLYWEEADWCYQAQQIGYKMLVCKTAISYDKISTSIGKGFLANYYYTLNGFLFLKKYKKNKIGIALVFAILRFLKRLVTGKFGGAKGVFKGVLTFAKQTQHESK